MAMRISGWARWGLVMALWPATFALPAAAEPLVLDDPQNWEGLTRDDYAASLEARIAAIADALAEDERQRGRAMQSAVAPATQTILMLQSSPYPALACESLDPLIEMFSADAVLASWEPARTPLNPPLSQNAEQQAVTEYLAGQFLRLRSEGCAAAEGASSAAARAAARAERMFDERTGRTGDAAAVFDSAYAASDQPREQWLEGALYQLVLRASAAQTFGDRKAYLRDAAELRRQTAGAALPDALRLKTLGGAGYLSMLAGDIAGTTQAIEALERIEPEPDRSCSLRTGLGALKGETFEQWIASAPAGCRESANPKSYYEMARTVATALQTQGLVTRLDPAQAVLAFPAWRLASEYSQAERSRRRPMAAIGLPYSDQFGGGTAANLLESAWFARQAGNPAASVEAAFAAAQDLTSSGYGQSLALSAAALRARDAGLGDLVADYEKTAAAVAERLGNMTPVMRSNATPPPAPSTSIDTDFERLRQLAETIRTRFPDYFALSTPQIVSIAEVQAALAEDEALLMLVATNHAVHVFAINRTGASWERAALPLAETNRALFRLVHDLRMSYPLPDPVVERWRAEDGEATTYRLDLAHKLYQAWLAPVAARLEGKARLITVASGIPAVLPLGVLVATPPPADAEEFDRFREAEWVAGKWVIDAAASADAFVRARAEGDRSTGAADRFLGFGDPVFSGIEQVDGKRGGMTVLGDGTHAGVAAAVRELNQLSRTAVEIDSIARLMSPAARTVTGAAATEAAVREQDWDGVAVASFATHGLMAVYTPDGVMSGLAFTPPAAAGDADDGFLSAAEVAALDMPVDLVILSACDTATALAFDNGGSINGLVRAFGFAGARRVMATSWPVNDYAASKLTRRMVELTRKGMAQDVALQQAAREFREDPFGDYTRPDGVRDSQAHPSLWGPFTIYGE